MTQADEVQIQKIIGGPIWVSTDDAQKVYETIVSRLDRGDNVVISFAGRETLITAFLNAAIGQLYSGKYSYDMLSQKVTFTDISEDDKAMIDHAIENAKRYFSNKPSYDAAWQDEADEDE